MVSWQVPHLSTCSRPDFNNDLGADSNNDISLGNSNLVSNEVYSTSVQVFCLQFPGGYYIWPRAACLISIMAQEMI